MSLGSGRLNAADSPDSSIVPTPLGGEEACSRIRTALHSLAKAEHDEEFALDLESGQGDASAMVEMHLSDVLDDSAKLRAALETVRRDGIRRDSRVEQCMKLGFRSLVAAEKLTTSIEETLYGESRPHQTAGLPTRSAAARESR